ncbi:Putative insulin-like peptide beta-type 6 [Caenorhabditis elegans]|uniref:Putative insulin-like peptide beta-type 6 n=1 Tax=Caenorhabditis elegans TaxID=6239 RepID=ILB6_CAEEL|nr:Putative insulin-like peptide beta-type 6 [Caenorhabditis elegans]P56173.2 RecName: Full=Putative insulin-like peptide beta-type 6; Flags: Precursor [Caenorhabditis elegans]CCD73332.1 Putative insulin-like peptide beta-type 6 [Caenorhabditis elegans]|eukprot:NP_495197.4 Putative insulin-like peptide beta-type 6 [Caenorhabditis elegans]
MHSIVALMLIGTILPIAALHQKHQGFILSSSDSTGNQPMDAISRADRHTNYRSCALRLIPHVWSVCGDACQPQNGIDVAQKCCSTDCSSDYIKEICCPFD